MRMTPSKRPRAIIRSPAVIDECSRRPDSGSAYVMASRVSSRTRARCRAASPPINTNGLEKWLIELDVDVQRLCAAPRFQRRLGVRAEDTDLLDRLRRARSAEPRRTVGGDEDQRNARVVRLDRRRQ